MFAEKHKALHPVSIGLPVFNGERHLEATLLSLLNQTYNDFELIISDNDSTDDTEKICREYASRDSRITYIRQKKNIGPSNNFLAVLQKAGGTYFKWQACDDIISIDFIEHNLDFLMNHPAYVASTSPNGFADKALGEQALIDFALEGDVFKRFKTFFENCWQSHGIFYSLIRTDILRGCEALRPGPTIFAHDWLVDVCLASKGEINRTSEGYMVFGVDGVSRGADAYKTFRLSYIECILPFYYFSRYVTKLAKNFTLPQRVEVARLLLKLNHKANRLRLHNWRNSRNNEK